MHDFWFKGIQTSFAVVLTSFVLGSAQAATSTPIADKDTLAVFFDEVHSKHGIERSVAENILSQAKKQQKIIELIQRPYEAKPWHQYRKIFLSEGRAKEGAKFWKANQTLLDKAEKEYGVPPEMIVAILGVETRYGRFTGQYAVLDALGTLAFHYPKRSAFFRKELAQFLALLNEESLPHDLQGSYAGAMGKAQFMPSSYRHYAVDFDKDGVRSLITSNADAIGSIANYFRKHGWQPNAPVAVPAVVPEKDLSPWIATIAKPKHNVSDLNKAGIKAKSEASSPNTANLLAFELEDSKDYWLGFQNFYVITRYNRSSHYAMAVFQLSEMIRDQFEALS